MIRSDIWGTYIDALGILQTPLQHIQNSVRLEIHNQHTAPRKHPKRALPRTRILTLRHAERLRLEGMPRPPPLHRVVREVRDGVN